jgi:hypothetical protein
VLSRVKVAFGAPTSTGRAKLPKTVTVKPPVPGKRPAKGSK